MELNNTGLNSFYHHPPPLTQPPQPTTTTTSAAAISPPPTNGISNNHTVPSSGPSEIVYSQAMPNSINSLENSKKKRGRPRKYFTPEQAAAAKRLAAASAPSPVYKIKKKDQGLDFAVGGGSSKSQLAAFGNTGQCFTPHVITVNTGEDVNQKISLFMQQSKREICIMSASGSVSNASLCQPATSGGSVTYEGHFNILSLKGSYVLTDLGGRTGGLSVCLSSSNGQIVGGSIGGPLIAAGPIEVIVGSFVIDTNKNATNAVKGDVSASKMPSSVSGASVSGVINFRSPVDSSYQNVGGSQYNIQPTGMQSMEWRNSVGHGILHSPENGDYDHSSE